MVKNNQFQIINNILQENLLYDHRKSSTYDRRVHQMTIGPLQPRYGSLQAPALFEICLIAFVSIVLYFPARCSNLLCPDT